MPNVLTRDVYWMDAAKDHGRHCPILALPVELRHAVYRCILFTVSKKVEVVTNSLEGGSVTKMRFYTSHDLLLLETNKQIRSEASDLLYAESVFTLYSYRRTQEYGQKPLYGLKSSHISLNRGRKCHILSPSGTEPRSYRSCVRGAEELKYLLQGVVDALAGGHCLRYLLVQSSIFERAVFSEELTMACDLRSILKPLERLRGLHICHIRAMKMCHWPYLRSLEREVTKCRSGPNDKAETGLSVSERALICKEVLTRAGVKMTFSDPDTLHANSIFEMFGIDPLYQDVGFLKYYEDDILS